MATGPTHCRTGAASSKKQTQMVHSPRPLRRRALKSFYQPKFSHPAPRPCPVGLDFSSTYSVRQLRSQSSPSLAVFDLPAQISPQFSPAQSSSIQLRVLSLPCPDVQPSSLGLSQPSQTCPLRSVTALLGSMPHTYESPLD